MRMLDNVIDINYYAVKKARDSNLRHRPVGLGMMGFQDALYELRIPYASRTRPSSSPTARWKRLLPRLLGLDRAGRRARPLLSSYKGSLWDRASCRWTRWTCWPGARRLRRGGPLGHAGLGRPARRSRAARHAQLQLRGHRAHGHHLQHHRRGRLIEPCFGNLSVKSNLSGEFTVINEYLVRDLKRLGLWDDVMVMDLKHFDGSLRPIDRVPQD
jgi:ribonucleoside-diphosphate reductase alpha chain